MNKKIQITASDAINLYLTLENLGIKVWFDGGWAVDALLGEQTRLHEDIDVVIQKKDLLKLRKYLDGKGYTNVERSDARAWNFALGDIDGRIIDVHVIVFDDRGNGVYGPAKNGKMYPAESLTGTGTIDGRKVSCISLEHLLDFHTGYEPREIDRRDVALLCKKFNVSCPQGYSLTGNKKNVC